MGGELALMVLTSWIHNNIRTQERKGIMYPNCADYLCNIGFDRILFENNVATTKDWRRNFRNMQSDEAAPCSDEQIFKEWKLSDIQDTSDI